MTESKHSHTPGPWHTHCQYHTKIATSDDKTLIATCGIMEIGVEEAEANAARIVACVNACEGIENPEAVGEVFDVLSGMFEYWDEGTSVHPNSLIVADLRAALAKAGVN